MGLVLFILFGFFVGLIARAVMPGNQQMGFLMTTGLGIAGSFTGGILVSLVTNHRVTDLHTAGFIGSVVGALLLLLIVGSFKNHRADA